jgi:hypothetical protein
MTDETSQTTEVINRTEEQSDDIVVPSKKGWIKELIRREATPKAERT